MNLKTLSFTQSTFISHNEIFIFLSRPKENRKISSKPYKILDAPGLSGDFYTSILDWTRQNLILVALNSQVYTWSPIRHEVNNLLVSPQTQAIQPNIISLSANRDGKLVATADEQGYVKIFDLEKSKVSYEYQAHTDRIGAVVWNDNLITTASKDFTIKIRDMRSNSSPSVLSFHKEVYFHKNYS